MRSHSSTALFPKSGDSLPIEESLIGGYLELRYLNRGVPKKFRVFLGTLIKGLKTCLL